jgi:hypothetical protein
MTQDKPILTSKFKLYTSALFDIAKALIIFEIALVFAFIAYFGIDIVNDFRKEAPTTSSVIEGDNGCFVQIIEEKVFTLCQE